MSDTISMHPRKRVYDGTLCYASSFLHVLASFNFTWARQSTSLPGPISFSKMVFELLSLLQNQTIASSSQHKHKHKHTKLLTNVVSHVWDAKLKLNPEYADQESRVIKVNQMLEEPQDINEFMDFFLEELNNDCKREQEQTGEMSSNIGVLFAGEKCLVKCCQSCSNLVHTLFPQERYFIPINISDIRSNHNDAPCLSNHSFRHLSEDVCEECGELCAHEEWLKGDSKMIPNILTIEMSRCIWLEGDVVFSDHKCKIPCQLLASFIFNGNNDEIYALRAVIVNSEKNYGHFYSLFCTDQHYKDWWISNDGHIQKVQCISQKLEAISGSWLLVFYEKSKISSTYT